VAELKFQYNSLFINISCGYSLLGSPLIGRLSGYKGRFNRSAQLYR
jgi:hypothetical protein